MNFLVVILFILLAASLASIEHIFWSSSPFTLYFSVELIIRLKLFGIKKFNLIDVFYINIEISIIFCNYHSINNNNWYDGHKY